MIRVNASNPKIPRFFVDADKIATLLPDPNVVVAHESVDGSVLDTVDFVQRPCAESCLMLPISGPIRTSRSAGAAVKIGMHGCLPLWCHHAGKSGGFSAESPVPAWLVPVARKDAEATMVWHYLPLKIELPQMLRESSSDPDVVAEVTLYTPILFLRHDAAAFAKDGVLELTRELLPKEIMQPFKASKSRGTSDAGKISSFDLADYKFQF